MVWVVLHINCHRQTLYTSLLVSNCIQDNLSMYYFVVVLLRGGGNVLYINSHRQTHQLRWLCFFQIAFKKIYKCNILLCLAKGVGLYFTPILIDRRLMNQFCCFQIAFKIFLLSPDWPNLSS